MENKFDSNDYNRHGGNQAGPRQRRPRISRPSGDGFRSNNGGYATRTSIDYSSGRDDRKSNGYKKSGYNSGSDYSGPNRGNFNKRGDEGGYQQKRYNSYNKNESYQSRGDRQYHKSENGYGRQSREYGNDYSQNNNFRSKDGNGYGGRDYNSYDRAGRNGKFQNRQFNGARAGENYNPHAKYSQKKQIEYKKQYVDYSQPMRLNKFLANAGICSRREADDYITAGVVTVNGEVISELGYKIIPADDKVMFHDQPVKVEKKVYILLNKPKDCVTTVEDTHERKTVLDLVKNACSERVYPVGRLDRNTTGVLLITNDGDLTSKLTHPKYDKKKIYQVVLDRDLEDADFQKIVAGITLEDGDIKVDEIAFVNEEDRKTVGVEIHSGRNRIVRRIFDSLGYRVMRLDRVYFAGLTKKNLPRGKWRYLSEMEVNMLKMSAAAMKD